MPLKKAGARASKATRRKVASVNIKRELKAGKPRKQAIAIGLRSAGLARKRKAK